MKLVLDLAYAPIVAVVKDDKVIKKIESKSEHSSDAVMKDIDDLFKSCNITLDDIDTICVNIGPGSFTGLRVAIAIAKAFNILHDKKFQVFSTFDYIESEKTKVFSAFSNYVYIKDSNDMDCVQIDSLKEGKYITAEESTFEKLKALNLDVEKRNKLDYAKIIEGKTWVSSSELRPLYLRKSQAEIMREQNLKNAK